MDTSSFSLKCKGLSSSVYLHPTGSDYIERVPLLFFNVLRLTRPLSWNAFIMMSSIRPVDSQYSQVLIVPTQPLRVEAKSYGLNPYRSR